MCTYQEYVVPRSIPITVPTSFLSAFSSFLSSPLTRSKLLAKARAQNVQIDFIMKICPIISYKKTCNNLHQQEHYSKILDEKFPSRLIFRSLPRVYLSDWSAFFLLADSDWSTLHDFVIFTRLFSDVVSTLEIATASQILHFRFILQSAKKQKFLNIISLP